MTTRTIAVENALIGPDYRPSGPVALTLEAGRIAAVAPLAAPPPGRRLLAMPALADAHNHGRPISTTPFAASGKPLEAWLPRLAAMPPIEARLGGLGFFGHAALGGVGSVMIHQTRTSGLVPLADEVRELEQAAGTIGIQAAYAVSVRDRNPLVYGDGEPVLADMPGPSRATIEALFRPPAVDPAAHVAMVEAIAAAVERPGFSVQFGPNGVQWCSDALLGAIAEASARSGRRVHMHLLETKYQRAWADRTFPDGIVRHLGRLGLLSPRLTLAHGVWARPEELAELAAAGVTVSVNTSSNLLLKSGIAPVAAMRAAGVAVALGLDNSAFDEDDDALRDLRLFKHLQAGWGYDETVTPQDALGFAAGNGRRSLGLDGAGTLAPGEPADLLLLDLDRLDPDRILPIDPVQLVFTRATKAAIAALIVAGRTIVEDGQLAGADMAAIDAEVRSRYRAGMADRAAFLAAWPDLEPRLARFYRDTLGCC